MYDILPLAAEKASETRFLLHPVQTVTVLYLDIGSPLWQYIVEVFDKWHNILCPVLGVDSLCLNSKRKTGLCV